MVLGNTGHEEALDVKRAGYDADEISMCYPTTFTLGEGTKVTSKAVVLAWVNGEATNAKAELGDD